MNILLRSFVAAGALTLLGAAYVDVPQMLGVASAMPSATFNLDDPDPLGAIAMQATASTTAVNASTSPQGALPRSPGSAAAPAVASKPLFLGDAAPSPKALAVAKQIADSPETSNLSVMEINPAAVAAQTREIALDLGTRRVNLVQEQAQSNADGSLTWIGHVKETSKPRPRVGNETPHDALNSAILIRRGDGVTGSVRMAGKLFRIRPLPGGTHAVIEVDESRRPADHPQSYDRMLQAAADAASDAGTSAGTVAAADAGALTTIRVMVAATDEAIAAYAGDMRGLVDLAVAETNQGYANSGIGIKLELAGYYNTSYVESGNWNTELDRFRGKTDGYLDGFHATRDAIAADVNVLIIDDGASCGLGYLNASADYAFSVVHHGCATGYYSFAHEIGHNQGATHDPATSSNSTFAYGHGYRAPDNTWRTVMAYNCTPSCPRVNYWSNPNVNYGGVPMGNANQSDNHRVLNETKAKIAAFRGESVPNVAPVAGFSASANNLVVAFTDSSTDSDGVVASRSWNFGDGTSSTAVNPSKTYAAAGTYNVSLTVTDDDGATHTSTKAVTVSKPVPVSNALANGVAKTGISGAQGSAQVWTLVVPAGASSLKFVTSGGSGDADLYVKFGSAPTTSSYDCRSESSSNAETCNIAVAQAGTYYVMVLGYEAFSGLNLIGSYTTGSAARTYSNATDYAIYDGYNAYSSIAVAGRVGNAPANASVSVDIVHPYRGDLKVELVAPDGSAYLLKATNSSDSADNVKATYTVNLSSEVLNGKWTLRVGDYYDGDAGYINSWSVTF